MYSDKVMDHFEHLRNVERSKRQRRGTVGNAKMRRYHADLLRYRRCDPYDPGLQIQDLSAVAVATSSMATEMVKGKTIEEAMQVTNKAVMEALDGLPPVKVHCSLLAEEAIHAALWDYAEKHDIKIQGLEKPKSDISEHDEDEEY